MRLFLACDIPDDSRERLATVQRRLRHVNMRVTWVAPRNFHFTLKFLGETAEETVAGIREAVAVLASETAPNRCELRGVGQFPRVIWAGLTGEVERLAQLARALDDALAGLGFPRDERGFKPHLTLGRIKLVGDKQGLTKALDSLRSEPFGVVDVGAVHLIQSTLTPQGSIYTKLFTAQLKGANHGSQI
jgi:2'-5' RNA ligase